MVARKHLVVVVPGIGGSILAQSLLWCSTHRQPAGSGRALVPVRRARITQTCEGTHQIRRVVMARQLLK